MKNNTRQIHIANIPLSETAGVGVLTVSSSPDSINLIWKEDWDNSQSEDRVEIDLGNGAIRHMRYNEDNFKGGSNPVEDRRETLADLQHIAQRIETTNARDGELAARLVRTMMCQIAHIRVNGRGNAWPLDLGEQPNSLRHSELVDKHNEYSNTSFSITAVPRYAGQSKERTHLLLDIGQGIVPFLIRQGSGFPNALIVSHSHFDHIAGLDWLVQTYARHHAEKLPVFTSRPCWDAILASHFSYLENKLELNELLPGDRQQIGENGGVGITGYPAFHGDFAPGAMMILLDFFDKRWRALFTGDLLCPLLRPEDWDELHGIDVVCVDTNTRFPCPNSGHWSIVDHDPGKQGMSDRLKAWHQGQHPSYLVTPHVQRFEERKYAYFDQFLRDAYNGKPPCLSIFEFIERIEPKQVHLVHYSGYEDLQNHGEAIMTDNALIAWTKAEWPNATSPSWDVPKPGDLVGL
jgi:hypothetical protein